MTKNDICREIIRLLTQTSTHAFMLDAVKEAIIDNDDVKLNRALKEAVLVAEGNALKTREIATHITGGKLIMEEPPNTSKMVPMDTLISRQSYDIKLAMSGDVLSVKLPLLMPTYHQDKAKSIFVAPLINAFERYVQSGKSLPCYSNAVMVFEHIIAGTQQISADNDNYAYRKLANIIASFVLNDDDCASCSFFYTSSFAAEAAKSYTTIHVIPKESFASWLSEHMFWDEARAA